MAETRLKPGWKVWRFEQMATNVNVRIDNPAESGMEHYVGLEHLDLGFAGRYGPDHPVHAALAALQTGDRLRAVETDAGGLALADRSGVVVGRFSRQGVERWGGRAGSIREVRVVAMIHRRAEQDPDPERQRAYRVEDWEFPAIELVVGAG